MKRNTSGLIPVRDSETARALGAKGIARKRELKAQREKAQAEAETRTREHLAKLAYEALFQALEGAETPVQARLTAARDALDRLEGRPTQRIETRELAGLEKARAALADWTPEELRARLRALPPPVASDEQSQTGGTEAA